MNNPHNRTGGMVSNYASGLGSTYGAISFYYDLIFMGHAPLYSITIGIKRGVVIMLLVIVTFKTNEYSVASHIWFDHHMGVLWAH